MKNSNYRSYRKSTLNLFFLIKKILQRSKIILPTKMRMKLMVKHTLKSMLVKESRLTFNILRINLKHSDAASKYTYYNSVTSGVLFF